MVAEEGRKWVMGTIGYLWRMHKSRVKEKHYNAHDTDEERWKWRPPTISEPQFEDLLNYWACSPVKVYSYIFSLLTQLTWCLNNNI